MVRYNGNRISDRLLKTASAARQGKRSEGVDSRFASRMIHLTCLAPDIVSAILDETLPDRLTLSALSANPPRLWSVQHKFAHTLQHIFGRRRNKSRIARPGAADPVLAAPELARGLIAAPALAQQARHEFRGKDAATAATLPPAGAGRNIVVDIPHVIQRDAGSDPKTGIELA